jgi:L-ascorbate metabolism protein UlaG (beta-lactamase superfamily)
MRLIAELFKPDLVLLPIGDNFGMGPVHAAYATRELVKPRYAIPMHYGANPIAKGTPAQYLEALGQTSTRVFVMKPGEVVAF